MNLIFQAEPFLLYGIIKGLLFALLAVGFCVVYKTTKIFHIAYGFIYTSASYFCLLFLEKLKFHLILSILLALIFTAILGLLIEKGIYFPLRIKKAPSGIYLVSSLGIYVIGINLIALLFGNETKILNSAIEKTFKFHNTVLTRTQLFQILWALCILSVFFFFSSQITTREKDYSSF